MTHTDSKELLESFEKELANQGIWYWTGNNGSKARILTAMQKMLKAGMSDVDVKEIIIDLQFAGYVEHEKQVKHKTGLSVKEYAEPGDDPRAPYRQEHFIAEAVERIVAAFIGVDWRVHCEYQQYDDQKS